MKSFRYETHLHTIEGSACAVSKAVDYIEVYKRIGYSGIFVTNHFFGGNTCVLRNLPWSERINMATTLLSRPVKMMIILKFFLELSRLLMVMII